MMRCSPDCLLDDHVWNPFSRFSWVFIFIMKTSCPVLSDRDEVSLHLYLLYSSVRIFTHCFATVGPFVILPSSMVRFLGQTFVFVLSECLYPSRTFMQYSLTKPSLSTCNEPDSVYLNLNVVLPSHNKGGHATTPPHPLTSCYLENDKSLCFCDELWLPFSIPGGVAPWWIRYLVKSVCPAHSW